MEQRPKSREKIIFIVLYFLFWARVSTLTSSFVSLSHIYTRHGWWFGSVRCWNFERSYDMSDEITRTRNTGCRGHDSHETRWWRWWRRFSRLKDSFRDFPFVLNQRCSWIHGPYKLQTDIQTNGEIFQWDLSTPREKKWMRRPKKLFFFELSR